MPPDDATNLTPLPVPRRLLLLAPSDNCLVACTDLRAGDEVEIDGVAMALPQAVLLGHKVARHALATGAKLLRWGAPIGSATQPIARAEHVHTHNLASDYLPTYTLDAGHAYVGKAEGPKR